MSCGTPCDVCVVQILAPMQFPLFIDNSLSTAPTEVASKAPVLLGRIRECLDVRVTSPTGSINTPSVGTCKYLFAPWSTR